MSKTLIVEFAAAQLAELQELRAEKAQRDRLNGVEIDYAEGTSKAGRAYRFLQVKGGPFSWRGLNLTPSTWSKLLELRQEIDAGMEAHFPGEM